MMPVPSTLRINGIFWSAQGEGLHAGVPSMFIRLSGCSLRCPYCDTKEAWEPGSGLTVSEVMERVMALKENHPIAWLIITGGEPLEQDLLPLIHAAKPIFPCIAVETNGLHFQDLPIDWWSVSPKDGAGYRIHPRLIPRISEIKLLANDNLEMDVVKRIRLLSEEIPIFLQPQHGEPEKFSKTLDFFFRFVNAGIANIRLGLQLHRIYNIP